VKIQTQYTRAASVADRWRAQYVSPTIGQAAVGKRLRELGPTPDPKVVEKIIGNLSWTACTCGVCLMEVAVCVEFTVLVDGYFKPVAVCPGCLQIGIDAINDHAMKMADSGVKEGHHAG